MDNKLPPLPPSDQRSLEHNGQARDFWKENQIIRIEDKQMEKCTHEFKTAPGGVECKKCHFGLLGSIEVRSGQLFYEGKPIGL